MTNGMWALIHRSCGHYGGLATDRRIVQDSLELLQAAGYHQWRIRLITVAEVTDAVRLMHDGERTGCLTCHVDPLRGLLPAAQQAAAALRRTVRLASS